MALLRNFCFTINNYTQDEIGSVRTLPYKYLIFGYETGKEGTPHIQGYCELTKRTRFNTIKSMIPRAHIEARKGTAKQAADYCKKDGDYEEFGQINQQGHRTDLDHIRLAALEGGMREVTISSNNIQQINVAKIFLTYHEEPRDWIPTVTWLWGPTGTGKSKTAREMLADKDYYVKSDGTTWWDGYDAHEAVIIDDFRDSWWSLTYMLMLLDRYECQVQIKGGYRQFKPQIIIVTSAYEPKTMYAKTGEAVQQLLRRITTIVPLVPEVGVILETPLPLKDSNL